MEPHSCHRFPAANDETDRPELKLVTFVTPTDAAKRHGRRKKSGNRRFFLTRRQFESQDFAGSLMRMRRHALARS